MSGPFLEPALDAADVVRRLPRDCRRLMLHGGMGSGKSALAADLAAAWPGPVLALSADPGTPAFGAPGAESLGEWQGAHGWRCVASVPLCTLDAVRFRLPLVEAVAYLARRVLRGTGDDAHLLIIDTPGVERGVGGSELLHGIAAAADVQAVIALVREQAPLLTDDLQALGCTVINVPAAPAARRPGKHERERRRTASWDRHLADAALQEFDLSGLSVIGTPPPRNVPEAWCGRQVALLRGTESLGMGEVVRLAADTLTVKTAGDCGGADALRVRDAWRNPAGHLVTAPPVGRPAGGPVEGRSLPSRDRAPLKMSVGAVGVNLVNGVFGDPLVELILPNLRGSLLFDLGDAAGLSVKALHAVTDVFVTHGHLDHIGGFIHLLRARLSGGLPPCRIYGPPGLHRHVAGFVDGVHWDRIGDEGPVFLVAETDAQSVRWARIQPGQPLQTLDTRPCDAGVLLEHPRFRVGCAVLDHGIPVLAFRLDLADVLQVREAALERRGLRSGPWLGELKQRLADGDTDAPIALPDGGLEAAGTLGRTLVRRVPGTALAYATDLADVPRNRRDLARLAAGVDLLICEATFLAEDAAQAQDTCHLTARGCVDIALQAGARRLLPFHFSRRYGRRLGDVYDELRAAAHGTRLAGKLVAW